VSRYAKIISRIFATRYDGRSRIVPFERDDIITAASDLGLNRPSNLGDVLYSYRYRRDLPKEISETAEDGHEWIIEGRGDALYEFRLVKKSRILPNESLVQTKIPDATPQIVAMHSLSDEQALLAKVRYNRLLDVFLGIVTYSLQNHLRTKVKDVGQVEIDEIYAGVDKHGRQYVIPMQAKGGNDQLSVVQTRQDLRCCAEKFPDLICRAVSAQFISDDVIVLFELVEDDFEIKLVEERHYRLVSGEQVTPADLRSYRSHGRG